VCPPRPGLTQSDNYCFHTDDTNRTQSEAEAYCTGYNSTLPYPTTSLKEWWSAILQVIPTGRLGPWSGATLQSDGEWRWPDGSSVQEDAWYPGWDKPGNCSEIGDVSGLLFNTPCSDYRKV
ncbi:unnamed protein product, partial [Meganyctiphanes norvegica]